MSKEDEKSGLRMYVGICESLRGGANSVVIIGEEASVTARSQSCIYAD